jgi:hypothetical protein
MSRILKGLVYKYINLTFYFVYRYSYYKKDNFLSYTIMILN